jgi:hypothetical protein
VFAMAGVLWPPPPPFFFPSFLLLFFKVIFTMYIQYLIKRNRGYRRYRGFRLTPRDYGTVRVLPATGYGVRGYGYGYGVGKPDLQYTRPDVRLAQGENDQRRAGVEVRNAPVVQKFKSMCKFHLICLT